VYDYHLEEYEARERMRQRREAAEAERMTQPPRVRSQERRSWRFPEAALDLLSAARRQARANA
jgi:hypothetical protein